MFSPPVASRGSRGEPTPGYAGVANAISLAPWTTSVRLVGLTVDACFPLESSSRVASSSPAVARTIWQKIGALNRGAAFCRPLVMARSRLEPGTTIWRGFSAPRCAQFSLSLGPQLGAPENIGLPGEADSPLRPDRELMPDRGAPERAPRLTQAGSHHGPTRTTPRPHGRGEARPVA